MNKKHFQGKHGVFLVFVCVLIVFFLILSVSSVVGIFNKIKEGKYIGQTKNTITVSDTGEIYAKPDLAIVSFSVITEDETVAQAIERNTERMNKVIDFIKLEGVDSDDLKTINFSIYPRYEWQGDEEKTRVLVGYEVRQTLEVKIRNMDKIGDIIQGGTDNGANGVGNLYFTIDDQDELKEQAREEAISKAQAKAKELASQLGVELLRISNFSESSYLPRFYALEESMGMGGGGPNIETGESVVRVTVSITYEIN